MVNDHLTIQELETLRQTALDLTSELEPKQLVEKIIKRSGNLLGADAGGIYLFDQKESRLKVEYFSGEGPSMLGNSLKIGEGLVGKVFQKGEYKIVDDYSQWEERSQTLDSSRYRAVIGVPLTTPAGKLGALFMVNYTRDKRFNDRDAQVLTLLAAHAAIALANAAEFARHRTTLTQLELINRLNERLTHAVDVDEILQITLEESLQAVNTREGSVMMLDDKTGELEIRAWIVNGKKVNAKGHKKFAPDEGVAGHVVKTGQPYNCTDTSKSEFFVPSFTQRKIGALLSVPIILHHRVFCIINADSKQPGAFSDLDMRMLMALAGHVAIAIESQLLRYIGISLSTLPIEELYPSIVKSAAQLTGSDVSTIFLTNETTGEVERAALFPASLSSAEAEVRGDGLTQRILDRGRLVRLTGWKLSRLARPEVLRRGVKSLLGAPLTVRTENDIKSIGVLFVSTTRQRHYEKRDEAILQSLANQAAIVIERKKNLSELQENVQFKESLLQNAFDAIVAVDESGIIKICNQSAQTILGISEREAIGAPVADFFLSKETFDEVLSILMKKGKVLGYYADVKNSSGEEIPIRLSCIRLEQGSVGFFQDRRELESAKRHREQLKQLMTAGQAITKLSDEGGVLQTAVEKTIETLKADVVCLYTYDNLQKQVLPDPACAGTLPGRGEHAEMFPLTLVEKIVLNDDIYCASNVRKDPILKNAKIHPEIASVVAGPLRVRDKIVGVIFCSYRQPRTFSDEEENAMMRLYFTGVATAIENARLYGEVHQRAKVIQGLYKAGMAHLLSSQPSLHLKTWLDQVRQVTNAGYATMQVMSFEQDTEPLSITSGTNSNSNGSEMEVPIKLANQPIGNLYVSDKQGASRFNTEDEEYLRMLAGSAAMMTELSRFRRQASSIQSTDIAFLLLCRWARTVRRRTSVVKKLMDIENREAELENDLLTELTDLLGQMDSPLDPNYVSVEGSLDVQIDLGELMKTCAKQVSSRLSEAATSVGAQTGAVPLTTGIEPNCFVRGNRPLLESAIDILLDNALTAIEEKNRKPVQLRLGCSSRDDIVDAYVTDTGPGIRPEIAKNLFQFPLIDASGLGYGAMTVGLILKVHKGSIRIHETSAAGTTFHIRLPAG